MHLYFNITVCLIAVLLTLSLESSESSTSFSGHRATGTVLFHNKKCWQHEDLALLSTRKIVQNLIPSNELDVSNDRYIANLIDYFRMCFSTVEKMSSGRSQDILLLALADGIGGYLHYYVIPVTKASFYHGNIRYDHARKLFQFYEEIKVHLDTSGKRWTPPMDTTKIEFKTRALKIPSCQDEDPCAPLLINDRNSRDSRSECSSSERSSPLPMPYLDDARTPTSIAVPFRASSLLPLSAPHAAFVLEKYFVAGSQCLSSRGDASRDDLAAFNVHLYRWLQQTIVPRLKDEQWYAAFGGVHRILKTIQASGYADPKLAAEGPSLPADEQGVDAEVQDEVESSEGNQDSIVTWSLLVSIGFGTLAAWIAVALFCVCIGCKCNGDREKSRRPSDDQYKLINTFVQIFYDMKGCPSQIVARDSIGSSGIDRKESLTAPGRRASSTGGDRHLSIFRKWSNSGGNPEDLDEDQRPSVPVNDRKHSTAKHKASHSGSNPEDEDEDEGRHNPTPVNDKKHSMARSRAHPVNHPEDHDEDWHPSASGSDMRHSTPGGDRRQPIARSKAAASTMNLDDHDDGRRTSTGNERHKSSPGGDRRQTMARRVSNSDDDRRTDDEAQDNESSNESAPLITQPSEGRQRSGSIFSRHKESASYMQVQSEQGGGGRTRHKNARMEALIVAPAQEMRGRKSASVDSSRQNSVESLPSRLSCTESDETCTDLSSSEEDHFVNSR